MTRRTYDLLTASPANVQANPPTSRLYQWLRNGSAISGATGQTYMTTEEDDGTVISVQQTETNFLGTATLSSLPSAQQVSSTLTQRVAELFANNEQGAWYDPSDYSTLYQDAAGTTPVTAVEQPVRLMLDRSRGLVLGSELATASSVTGVAIGGPTFTNYTVTGVLTQNRWYKISFTVSGYSGTGSVGVAGGVARFEPDLTNELISANGTVTVLGFWVATGVSFQLFTRSTNTCNFTNISVRELPGNHALAPNDASRPVLRARYNQLLNSEDFSTSPGGWTQTGVTVSGQTITATAGAGHHRFSRTTGVTTPATVSAEASAGTVNRLTIYDGSSVNNFATFELSGAGSILAAGANSTATISSLGAGRYRCVVSYGSTNLPNGNTFFGISDPNSIGTWGSSSFIAAGTETLVVHNTQLLTAADHAATGGAYQRVGAATDYDTGPPWRPYLAFDGSDDHFILASAIPITTDMTVVRGFGRSAAGIHSIGISSDDQHEAWFYPDNKQYVKFGTTQSGSASTNTGTGGFVTTAKIVGLTQSVRLNGVEVLSAVQAIRTGNFTQIGKRGTVYNNGPIYGLILVDRELTAAEITRTEMYMASKTGVNLS